MTTLYQATLTATKAKRAPRTARRAAPVKQNDFKQYLQAQDQARQAVGYDSSSPIFGKTRIEVLQTVLADLTAMWTELGHIDQAKATQNEKRAYAEIDLAKTQIADLLKREIAKVEAGKAYHSR